MARKKTITENISEPKKPDVISGRENYVNIFQKLGFRVLLESGVLIFLVTDYKENDKIMHLLDAHGYKGSYGFQIYKKPTDIGFLYIIQIIHPSIHNIIQCHLL